VPKWIAKRLVGKKEVLKPKIVRKPTFLAHLVDKPSEIIKLVKEIYLDKEKLARLNNLVATGIIPNLKQMNKEMQKLTTGEVDENNMIIKGKSFDEVVRAANSEEWARIREEELLLSTTLNILRLADKERTIDVLSDDLPYSATGTQLLDGKEIVYPQIFLHKRTLRESVLVVLEDVLGRPKK
ncbi:MAG: hypothetical protein Q7K42_03140, partial [Candidatus Diapherotrites archaeon]|nr:hypothetical protein [Candidatus Diapherotrites archaeon]